MPAGLFRRPAHRRGTPPLERPCSATPPPVAGCARHRDAPPPAFAEAISVEQHAKAASYTLAKTRLGLVHLAIEGSLLWWFTLGGGLNWLNGLSASMTTSPLWAGTLMLLGMILVSGLAEIPLSVYRQFGVEARFGFNRQTLGGFVIDLAKETLLGTLNGAIVGVVAAIAMIAGLVNRRLPGPGARIILSRIHYSGIINIGDAGVIAEPLTISGGTVQINAAGDLGAAGIGKATVERFLEEGAEVAVIDISEDSCSSLSKELEGKGFEALMIPGDVSQYKDVQRVVGLAAEGLGGIDVLFNNAGILVEGSVEQVSEEDWDRIMSINVKGVFLMCKEVVPLMLRQGKGAIVNNASCSGLVGDRNAIAYNTSKGAVVLMTKCLALDYAQKGIRVNCVCPGEIDTPMFRQEARSRNKPVEEYRKELCEYHPIGRLGVPKEVANAVVFLASDDASFVTGAAFSVDGGYTCQ